MQPRAVDLIKVAPKPAARPSAAEPTRPGVDANEPKPRSRFDHELSRHTRTKDEPAKPDAPKSEPAVKAKAKPDAKTKPADAAKPTDAADAADLTDTETAAAESDNAPAKTEQTKAKPVKKADAKKAGPTDADGEQSDEAAATANTSPPVTLPTAGATATDGDDLVIDVDAKKGDADKADADADAPADADALAAQQLVAQQAAGTSPTASSDSSTESTDADAATTPASATPASTATATKSAATQSANGRRVAAATDEPTEIVPRHAHAAKATDAKATDVDANADAEIAGAFQLPPEAEKAASASGEAKEDAAAIAAAIQPTAPHDKSAAATLPPPVTPQAAPARDVAEHNVDQIVTSVRGELLTKGGTMDIRLDPPTLGHVQVQITVDDGVLSANIQTNNDEATRLLSHNLAQLKTQLESTGVTVDRIQVKQATPAEQTGSSSNRQGTDGDSRQHSAASQDQSARHEQQRREALQRMWARVAGNGDPLDLVA